MSREHMWRETREDIVSIALPFAAFICVMGLLATGGEFLICLGSAIGVLGLLSSFGKKRAIGIGFAMLLPLSAYLTYQANLQFEESRRQAIELMHRLREGTTEPKSEP